MKKVIYVCPLCGGANVISRAWVDSNTGKLYEYIDDRDFCLDCGEEVCLDEKTVEGGVMEKEKAIDAILRAAARLGWEAEADRSDGDCVYFDLTCGQRVMDEPVTLCARMEEGGGIGSFLDGLRDSAAGWSGETEAARWFLEYGAGSRWSLCEVAREFAETDVFVDDFCRAMEDDLRGEKVEG